MDKADQTGNLVGSSGGGGGIELTMATAVAATQPAGWSSSHDFYLGLGLACSSSLFIGSSFVFKKKGLLKLAAVGKRAGDGGYGYLREPLWWAGVLLMAFGEGANFAAYAFAPASLVTPLGALSVLVAAILSSRYLGERLNVLGKVGCLLSLIGSTVFVLHAPKEEELNDLHELAPLLIEPGFLTYMCMVVVLSLILMVFCERRWGHSNVLVYIMICSVIGSLSVMGCKGVGIGLKSTISGNSQLGYWLFWALIAAVVGCIAVQLVYLNRALDTFNTSVVTPVYYVLFTAFVVLASAVLYKEWRGMDAADIVGSLCGFFVVVVGIFILHVFKDVDVSLHNLPLVRKRAAAAAAVDISSESVAAGGGGGGREASPETVVVLPPTGPTAVTDSSNAVDDDSEWCSSSVDSRTPLLPHKDIRAYADKPAAPFAIVRSRSAASSVDIRAGN